MKTIITTDSKITLLQIVKKHLFQNKKCPVLLYNLYGCDRYMVDKMLEKNGFWKTTLILLNT